MSIFLQNVKRVEEIVEELNGMFKQLEKAGIPVRLNDNSSNTLTLYYNNEYGKIFVDKWVSQHEI